MDLAMNELLGGGAIAVIASATLIQIAPVKINPWSAFARAIGRAINGELIEKVESLEKEVQSLRDEGAERAAKDCRVRILRFGDEVLHDKRHTKEHFDQILQDITEYDKYCDTHKDFKNNMTVMTTEHIKATYEQCMEEHSFL